MKRMIAILLLAALLTALCGCSGKNESEPAPSAGGKLPEPAVTVPATQPDPFDFGDVNYTLHLPVYELVRFTVLEEPYAEYSDFVYNEKGQLISKRWEEWDETYLYEYDEQGRLVKETEIDSDDDRMVYYYTYYDTPYAYFDTRYGSGTSFGYGLVKKMTRSATISFYDNAVWDYTYEFDDQGRVIRETSVFPTDYVRDEIWYEYNDQGLISRKVEHSYYDGPYDRESDYDSEYVYIYDSAGRLVQEEAMLFASYDDYPSYYTDTFEYEPVATREISTQTNPELLTADRWEGFSERYDLPMPDTCVDTIEYAGRAENTAAVVYSYTLPGGQQSANEEYYKFQQILSEVCGFRCENRNDMLYIHAGDQLIALTMAGNDPELGYFVQLSFPSGGLSSSVTVSPQKDSESFTNKFGTPDTVCVHRGCSSYIASSGDTNCCVEHSNECMNCGCYIDGDAMYCMGCLESVAN